MAEHVDERIFRGGDQAFGHFRFALGKTLVHAGHHHVQFRQQIIVEIQSALGENVHFRACQ